jgi:hypothetical protein
MPQRTGRTVTVTGGPQGDDAFVVIKRMTVDESTAFAKLFANVQGAATEEQELAVRRAVSELVLDWNFVGDDDQPLPKPHGNAEVVGQLLNEELKWLFEAITGSTDGQKKDLKPTLTPS